MIESPTYSRVEGAVIETAKSKGFSGELKILKRIRKAFPYTLSGKPGCDYLHSRVKTVLDRAIGASGLIITSPVITAALAATKFADPKEPVLYKSNRIGEKGEIFEMTKIRTMKTSKDPVTYAEYVDKSRINPVGRFIRAASIDEFTQFYDMLTGKISAVGIRAVTQEIIDNQILPNLAGKGNEGAKWLKAYESATPGCTGLAQILGHNNLRERHRRKLDRFYAEHASLGLDLYILTATPAAIIKNALSSYKKN